MPRLLPCRNPPLEKVCGMPSSNWKRFQQWAKARTCCTNKTETYWTSIVMIKAFPLNQILGWAVCLPACLFVCLFVCLPCAATSFLWPDALSLSCNMYVYFFISSIYSCSSSRFLVSKERETYKKRIAYDAFFSEEPLGTVPSRF